MTFHHLGCNRAYDLEDILYQAECTAPLQEYGLVKIYLSDGGMLKEPERHPSAGEW
jgi:hypothetical protein